MFVILKAAVIGLIITFFITIIACFVSTIFWIRDLKKEDEENGSD